VAIKKLPVCITIENNKSPGGTEKREDVEGEKRKVRDDPFAGEIGGAIGHKKKWEV